MALLFTLSSYIVWTSFSTEPNRNTTNNKNILILFLITLIFRSVSLSNRLILHEPTETHISTFLAWRLKKIQEFQIQYPEEGFNLLKQHYLKYRHKDAIRAPIVLQKGTNVVLIILESFASRPMAKKPEIAPFLSSFQKTLGTVRLNNHFAVVQRTVGAQFSLWSSRYDPQAFYVIRDYPFSKVRVLPKFSLKRLSYLFRQWYKRQLRLPRRVG